MGKKSGKKSRVERPDATQGGPRAKVKKERVQPPKSVLRPSDEDTSTASAPDAVTVAALPSVEPKAEQSLKGEQKKKTSKNDKTSKKDKASKQDKGGMPEADSADTAETSENLDKLSKTGKASKKKAKKTEKAKDGTPAPASAPASDGGAAETPPAIEAKKAKKNKKTVGATREASASEAAKPVPKRVAKPKQAKQKLAQTAKKPAANATEVPQHTVRAGALLADEGDDAHGFARLIRAMPGIVALVEQHNTAVHRAVFDSYVTAVVEHGVDAADLAPIDIRTAAPDALSAAEPSPAATGRSGSAGSSVKPAGAVRAGRARRPSGINSAAPEAASTSATAGAQKPTASSATKKPEPVRSPRSSVRASTRARGGQGRASAPKDATGSAAQERTATTPIASRTRAGSRTSAAGTSRAATPKAKSLEVAAAELKPTNNGQRIALVIAAIINAKGDVSAATVADEFERMTWRVPVNVAASIRQAARAGLVDLEGPTGTRLTPAGEAYVSGS